MRGLDAADEIDLAKSGNADAFAENKQILLAATDQLPDFRVLDGRFSTAQHGSAVVKGHDAGALFVKRFVEESKADGSVRAAIEHAALREVVVAPLR